MINEAMRFEGHMDVNIIRRQQTLPRCWGTSYVIILRFNTDENLQKWERSQERKKWLEKSKDVIEGEPKVEVRSNLELWFTPRGTNGSRPAAPTHTLQDGDSDDRRHIISILLTPLISAIQQVTEGQLPFLSRMLLVVAIMLLLMTHVLMPSIIRVLRPWLSKKTLF
jgi:uncharacterized protein